MGRNERNLNIKFLHISFFLTIYKWTIHSKVFENTQAHTPGPCVCLWCSPQYTGTQSGRGLVPARESNDKSQAIFSYKISKTIYSQ